MYTSDCVWNCFAFVMALRWAIEFHARDVAEAAFDHPYPGDDRARPVVRGLPILERQWHGDDHNEDRPGMRVPSGGLSRCEDRVLDEHPAPVRIGGAGDRRDRDVLDPGVGNEETQSCGAGRQLGRKEMGRVRHTPRQDAPHETDDEREREPPHGLLLLQVRAAAMAVTRALCPRRTMRRGACANACADG